MSWFSSSLRAKILAGSLIAVLALLALLFVHLRTASIQQESATWVNHTCLVQRGSQKVHASLQHLQSLAFGSLATGDPRFGDEMIQAEERVRQGLNTLRLLVRDNPDQLAQVDELRGRVDRWLARAHEEIRLGGPERAELADAILTSGPLSIQPIRSTLMEFDQDEEDLLNRRIAQNAEARRLNRILVGLGCGLAILILMNFTVWLSSSLVTPLRALTEAMHRLQAGDLDARVAIRRNDELGQLVVGFNSMAVALRKNLHELGQRDIQAGVLRVSEVLATTTDLAHLLDETLERILDVTHCPAGAIYLRSLADETLRALVTSGTRSDLVDQVIHPGAGMVGRVARSREPCFASSATDPEPFRVRHWNGEQVAQETAYLPLCSGPELVGVLTLAGVVPFDDRTRNILQIVAGQLGAAIQNALSHQTLQRQAVELEARNQRLADQQQEIERQNRELRVSSQLKNEFLANMSHELRTPLTIILGFTNTVLRGTQGELNPEQRESLKRVYENARQLLSLINDILDLSKIEAGQMELDPSPTLLAGLLEAVADSFRNLAETKGLQLRTEIASDLPGEVLCDETRLRQVVMNLVSNALKFTDRGEVVLAVRPLGAETYEIEVRDTGPGIAEADLPKIFEQFRQLDGRTNRRAGGTGLGLSIVKRLVELLGGALEVRSRVGFGTSFFVRLPNRPDRGPGIPRLEPDEMKELDDPSPSAAGRLVLSIDDDPDFLALLREALKETSFRFRSATTGREGLELAVQLHPDVITLDVMMPEMDGWKVLNELKAHAATAEVPVILLSVLERRGLGLMLGAADYLTKPVDRNRLIQSLSRVGAPRGAGPILVIDDDPDIRQMLSLELKDAGYVVQTAADGVEGLSQARTERPALVILDLMMPGMDGFAVATELHRDERTHDVPILILTAKDLDASDILRLNGQIEEIVQKGAMNVDALLARLVGILRSIGVVPMTPVSEPPAVSSQPLAGDGPRT